MSLPCRHPDPEATRGVCSLCRVYCTDAAYRAKWDGTPPPPPPPPEPYEQWPTWVKAVARMRADGEAGVGDTAHRLLETMGVGWFWQTFVVKLTGNCKCEARRKNLNARHPYPAGG